MKPKLYAYFGHHKCASKWIADIASGVCRNLGLKFLVANVITVGNHKLNGHTMTHDLSSLAHVDFLAYINAIHERVSQLRPLKGFHVIRDPRDICVSAYYSHLYSHPVVSKDTDYIMAMREKLKRLSKEEGLLETIRGRREQFEAMYDWDYSQPNILEVKFEDFVKDPYEGFIKIFQYLDLLDTTQFSIRNQVSHLFMTIGTRLHKKTKGLVSFQAKPKRIRTELLLVHVYNHRFSKKAKGRRLGQENSHSHYRKGTAGDWVNHFRSEHIRFFKENYNDVLIKLGYECDDKW